ILPPRACSPPLGVCAALPEFSWALPANLLLWPQSLLRPPMRYLVQGLLHLFYPRICWICRQMRPFDDPGVCSGCSNTLLLDPHATCPRCSSTVGPFIDLSTGCPACRDTNLAFDRALRLGPYDGLLREVVLRMKQRGGEG